MRISPKDSSTTVILWLGSGHLGREEAEDFGRNQTVLPATTGEKGSVAKVPSLTVLCLQLKLESNLNQAVLRLTQQESVEIFRPE